MCSVPLVLQFVSLEVYLWIEAIISKQWALYTFNPLVPKKENGENCIIDKTSNNLWLNSEALCLNVLYVAKAQKYILECPASVISGSGRQPQVSSVHP